MATATGNAQSITFQAQPSNTNIIIVATKQDRLRYVGNIHVINEPMLTVTEVVPHDANGNQQLEYGEQSSFDMVIKNTGNMASSIANATLSTRTLQYVTINESTATIPALAPNQATDLNEVFGITVSDAVPNGTDLEFTLTMVSEGHTWTSHFTFDAYAPNFQISDIMTINDASADKGNGNGRLDPGENAVLIFTYTNNGGAAANNVTAILSTTEQQYITISNPTVTQSTLDAGETVEVSYLISVAATMPRGEEAHFILHTEAGNYARDCNFAHRVGLEIANFENGLEGFEWENDPDHPWTVSTEHHSGEFGLQSGTIGLNASSTLTLHFDVENETDEIRFFRKTDCHTSDYLKFYIDGTEVGLWNGDLNWREMAYPVTQGEHTFTWTYVKDGSGTAGSDRVYLDDILFPVRHISFACNAGADQDRCFEAAQLEGNVIGGETLLWTTVGDGSFDHNDIINPVYTPGEQDLANKMVVLTLTATNEAGETLSDNVIINYHEGASIVMDDEGSVCQGEAFQANAIVNETGSVSWTTSGDGSFDRPDNVNANYIPGEQDLANGQVMLMLNAFSSYGCGDASHDLLLTIHPLQHTEIDRVSCGTYLWNGIEYSEPGDYEQTLQSIYGCDSTVVMHLSMVDVYNTEVEQTACDSYEWAGETLTASGTYTHIFTSMHGCDSIVVMHLTIYESWQELVCSVDACESYTWNSITYTEGGIYEQIFTDIHGCDSIPMIDLAVMYAPVIEAFEGDTEVDVRLTPTSVYTTSPSMGTFWSIEPEEAGTIESEYGPATITWSNTYKGEAVIKVWALNYCGQTESSLTVNVKNSTDVNEYSIRATIYPNPTEGIVSITGENLRQAEVANMLGQRLFSVQGESDVLRIDMISLPVGVYFVTITDEEGRKCVRKVVKE